MKKLPLIMISIVSILALSGCNKNLNTLDDSYKSQEDLQNSTSIFTQYSFASDDTKTFIVAKDNKDNWNEITESYYSNILGTYDDKFYFTTKNGIYYIDLKQKPYTEVPVIEYRDIIVYTSDYPLTVKEYASNPHMIKDEIYFNFMDTDRKENIEGIQKINIHSKSLDEAVQVVKEDVSNWDLDPNNNVIYYLRFGYGTNETLYKYNIEDGTTEVMCENVEDIDFKSNKSLYCTDVITTKEVPYEHQEIFLYDAKTKHTLHISDTTRRADGSSLSGYAVYHDSDNTVYYKSGDSVIKYNNGNNNVIYTYTSKDGLGEFPCFYFISEDVIKLYIYPSRTCLKYLKNGELYKTFPEEAKTKIIMKDGTVRKMILHNY